MEAEKTVGLEFQMSLDLPSSNSSFMRRLYPPAVVLACAQNVYQQFSKTLVRFAR